MSVLELEWRDSAPAHIYNIHSMGIYPLLIVVIVPSPTLPPDGRSQLDHIDDLPSEKGG